MLEGLDAVDWRGLDPDLPATDLPKVLRRIARADATTPQDAVERTYGQLQELLLSRGRFTDACTASLPFLVDLALDPDTVGRPDAVDVLASLAHNGAARDDGSTDAGWDAAWRRQWPRLRRLLGDRDPGVRRAALHLVADRTAPLLERWRVETDLSVRVTLLLALGEAAASEDPASATADEVCAVLDAALHGEDRVLRVAAVIATCFLDPQAALRACPMLLDILCDPALAPEFGRVWYTLNCEYPYDRGNVAGWVVGLLERDTGVAVSFVAGLAEAGSRTGDADLRRCALDEAWRLLERRPSAATTFLPMAAGLLADPDDDVRYKATHLLAVIGRRAAPYADRLAALLDDTGESQVFDGTVGEHARWALTRIGDPRALPDLVERLVEPYRDMPGRGYGISDPRQPDVVDVLTPLRAHAEVLLPAVREALRDEVARSGWLVGQLRDVLRAWGEDPLLPGETTPHPQPWSPPLMTPAEAEAAVLASAPDGEPIGPLVTALASIVHHGRTTTPVREALAALRDADIRLSQYGDYRTFLQDEEIRERMDAVLALP